MPQAIDQEALDSPNLKILDINKPPSKSIPYEEFPRMVFLHPKDKTKEHRTLTVNFLLIWMPRWLRVTARSRMFLSPLPKTSAGSILAITIFRQRRTQFQSVALSVARALHPNQ